MKKGWFTGIFSVLLTCLFIFGLSVNHVDAAAKKPAYQVVSRDGDFTVIQQYKKFGVLYKNKPWLPIVYDKVRVNWEYDSQFYVLTQRGSSKQLFFKPKNLAPVKIIETSNGNIEFVNGDSGTSVRPYIVLNDYQNKKVVVYQRITNKPIFSLTYSNLVFMPANSDTNYRVFLFYNYANKTYSVRNSTDFTSLGESLRLPFIPTSARYVQSTAEQNGSILSKRYIEFTRGTSSCYYDRKTNRVITIPGAVDSSVTLLNGTEERLIVSYLDVQKKSKLMVDGKSVPYDLKVPNYMLWHAKTPQFFGSNSNGMYGAIDVFTGQITIPFEFRLLKTYTTDSSYINAQNQIMFVPYPYSKIVKYDQYVQMMADSRVYYKIRNAEDYWIADERGNLLIQTNSSSVLVPPVKTDALGRMIFAHFGIREGNQTQYYFQDMEEIRPVPIYSKEQLTFNTLNVYLTNVFQEYNQYSTLYYLYENNQYYLANQNKQKLSQQAYVHFQSFGLNTSNQYLVADIQRNKTFDLYTPQGHKINQLGPLQYFSFRDIKSDIITPFDITTQQNNQLVVQYNGKRYEIKNDQMVELK